MSIHQQIVEKIANTKGGEILFPNDFRGVGADSAIKMSLSRITKAGGLTRLSHGIYRKPKKNERKDDIALTPEEIVEAIAKQEKIKVRPSGPYALYKLGFSNDTPSTLTFITEGEPRKIVVNEHVIVFKATTPKKLAMKGAVSGLLIQALEEIGKKNITADLEQKIAHTITKEDDANLMDDIKNAPAWIYNLLIQLKKNLNNKS